jgi:hypothetical protein
MNLKNVIRKKMYVYVPAYNSMLIYLTVMCIFVIHKCLSGAAISSKIWASQAIDGKLLSILSYVVGETT